MRDRLIQDGRCTIRKSMLDVNTDENRMGKRMLNRYRKRTCTRKREAKKDFTAKKY